MQGRFHIGEWSAEPQLNSLAHADRTLHIEPKAMQVLVCLAENAGEVVTKQRLIRLVWADTFVGDDVLTRVVSDLRKAFGDDAREPRFIQTIPKSGYRLLIPVVYEPVKQEANSQAGAALTESTPEARPGKRWLNKQVLAACLLIIGVGAAVFYAWTPGQPKRAEAGAVRSIAVLPFKPLVTESRDEALELGMADTVILKLSNLRELIVRPVSAVRKYMALDRDPITAGREQGVDTVLDASLQTAGERVRVSARLLRVSDGSTLWTYKCDEQQCANLFQMQDAIAEKVAGALALALTSGDRERLTKRYTDNAEAFRLYSLGRLFWSQWTKEGLKKSIEYYQKAIALDRDYALAYAGIADSYCDLGSWFGLPIRETLPKGKEAALKALEIDNTLAEAHCALGRAKYRYERDWAGAERELKRAIELNPNYGLAHSAYSLYLSIMGQWDEAIAEAQRGRELEPLSFYMNYMLGRILSLARQYDQAIEQCRKSLDIEPNHLRAHNKLAHAYFFRGMPDEAVAEFDKMDSLSGIDTKLIAARRKAYETAGIRGYLQKRLEQMKEEARRAPEARHFTYISVAFDIAEMYALVGDKEQAFAWLEKAYEENDPGLNFLKGEPGLDSLRSDRRFTNLLQRMGLAP